MIQPENSKVFYRVAFGQRLAHLELKCERCGEPYQQQARVFARSKWKHRCKNCRGEFKDRFPCPDCGKLIWRGSEKCKKCSHARATRPKCVDCQIEIGLNCKRCLPCHNKKQNKGKSRERTLFNVSQKWAKARTACFVRDNFTCQNCLTRGGFLHAHHIKGWKNHPNLRLTISNLLTLCETCHAAVHGLTKKAA